MGRDKDLLKIMEDVEKFNKKFKEDIYSVPIKIIVVNVIEGDEEDQYWDIDINRIKKRVEGKT